MSSILPPMGLEILQPVSLSAWAARSMRGRLVIVPPLTASEVPGASSWGSLLYSARSFLGSTPLAVVSFRCRFDLVPASSTSLLRFEALSFTF